MNETFNERVRKLEEKWKKEREEKLKKVGKE